LRKDHRPYFIKKAYNRFQKFYLKKFLKPEFESLGHGIHAIKPWHMEVFGGPVRVGSYTTLIASPDAKVRLCVWSDRKDIHGIEIGEYCLICPGARISAAEKIVIGANTMLANGVYITDADWHDIYDRSMPIGVTRPVIIGENVWLGDSVIVCKGVTIGKNSIIGAGSVVVKDIPENCIAAGNPAQVLRTLDPDRKIVTRGDWLSDPREVGRQFDLLDRDLLRGNTIFGWIRSLVAPRPRD
jgi:acetyltransferase-like isoleucine patch superfamily enzyme